ncbi:MAG: hypothetical protein M4579_002459 [Chaenotheca gracillima]|nr:MAG: hypothetical protein M4579_002459 [Chaenotheca gracillima]
MEQFAQTRAPDDLFDDDFTPVSDPVPEPVPQVVAPSGPKGRGGKSQGGPQSERGNRGRGRGRGRDRESRKENPPATSAPSAPSAPPATETPQVEGEGEVGQEDKSATLRENGRSEAVRGDRSGTGGVRKPKLSEDELSTRLASIKLKNAAREAAHARAEADEASFNQREQQERAKRIEERQNRREMDSEREKNRQRKMKAVQGREWDAEKKEEDMVAGRGRGSQFRRGVHGGVTRNDGDRGAGDSFGNLQLGDGAQNGRGDYSTRGPRSRGGRGGRGRGRGRGGSEPSPSQQERSDGNGLGTASRSNADGEFPALPATKADPSEKNATGSASGNAAGAIDATPVVENTDGPGAVTDTIPLMSPKGETKTWADQMEAGTPVTPA